MGKRLPGVTVRIRLSGAAAGPGCGSAFVLPLFILPQAHTGQLVLGGSPELSPASSTSPLVCSVWGSNALSGNASEYL